MLRWVVRNPITRKFNRLDYDIITLFYFVYELENDIQNEVDDGLADVELLETANFILCRLHDMLVKLYGNEPLEDFYSLGRGFWEKELTLVEKEIG